MLADSVWYGVAAIGFGMVLASCRSPTDHGEQVCEGFADWRSAPYVLPYAVGQEFTVLQGNCAASGNGHRDANRYGYDFGMPIGTPFVAARRGVVLHIEESHVDGEVAPTGFDNYITIQHDDETVALYGRHLTQNGALVGLGHIVDQGEQLGWSGNTGNTANISHLHFSVHKCDPVVGGSQTCGTLPVTFRNADPNPEGLQQGRSYRALPYP